jgi:hypothetical protein
MNTPRMLASLIAILVLFTPFWVNANSTNYGTLVGSSVDYSNIVESTVTAGDSVPLYGAPVVIGNSLVFNQMTFSSVASNGTSDITDGKLDTTMASKNNNYINSITFQEFGDTTLSGTGTSATRSSIANNLFLTVLAVDNVPLVIPQFISVGMAVSPTNQWTLAGGQITGQQWSGLLNLNLSNVLQSRGITGHATQVSLSMDNTLSTSSEANTQAFIAKKAAGLSVTPEIIPEPSTVILVGMGLMGLLAGSRRKRA